MSMSNRKGSRDVTGAAVLFKVLYSRIKKVFFFLNFLCLFYVKCILCEKYYKPLQL